MLAKGLSYIPTPRLNSSNKKTLIRDLGEFGGKYIKPWLERVPGSAGRTLSDTVIKIRQDFYRCSPLMVGSNLSKGEKRALRELAANPELVISKADKGDAVVVLSTPTYLDLAYEHLNDKNTYKLLRSDPTGEIVTRFIKYLKTCRESGVITTQEYYKYYYLKNS